jgi:hypothetical protein
LTARRLHGPCATAARSPCMADGCTKPLHGRRLLGPRVGSRASEARRAAAGDRKTPANIGGGEYRSQAPATGGRRTAAAMRGAAMRGTAAASGSCSYGCCQRASCQRARCGATPRAASRSRRGAALTGTPYPCDRAAHGMARRRQARRRTEARRLAGAHAQGAPAHKAQSADLRWRGHASAPRAGPHGRRRADACARRAVRRTALVRRLPRGTSAGVPRAGRTAARPHDARNNALGAIGALAQ